MSETWTLALAFYGDLMKDRSNNVKQVLGGSFGGALRRETQPLVNLTSI